MHHHNHLYDPLKETDTCVSTCTPISLPPAVKETGGKRTFMRHGHGIGSTIASCIIYSTGEGLIELQLYLTLGWGLTRGLMVCSSARPRGSNTPPPTSVETPIIPSTELIESGVVDGAACKKRNTGNEVENKQLFYCRAF